MTGLVINVSFDSSVDNAPSGFKAAVAAAVNYFDTTFANPVAMTIQVGYGEIGGVAMDPGTLGESQSSGVYKSYAEVAAALPADGLPASNPTGNGLFYVADAQAKLLGMATDGSAFDGAIGVSDVYPMNFDPNNRAIAGEYDAVGVIVHEISEVMGRTSALGVSSFQRQPLYTPLDLFRYSAAGVRLLTSGVGYFSADGSNLQTQFNNPANGGDGGDWAGGATGDAFGAGNTGFVGQITRTDLAVMQALGLSTIGAVIPPIVGPAATVVGVGGAVQVMNFDSSANVAIAQALLNIVDIGIGNGQTVAGQAGAPPTLPAGRSGLAQVTAGGQYAIAAGYAALVDAAATPATVFGGASNGQIVVAGSAGLAFNAGSGSGTVIAGGGNNLISVLPGAGAQNILTGGGNDTISVLTGNNIISAGSGINQILAQGGNDSIISAGTDLISAPDGRATIIAGSNNPTVFLGSGAANFNGGNGQATVVVGSAAATLNSAGRDQLWLQAGGGVVNSGLADTIIGGSGAGTVNAGTGNDFVFAGSGRLSFNAGSGVSTILGAAAGVVALAGGAGSLIAVAYGTTSYIGGSGADTVAAFGGNVSIIGGSGIGVFLGGPAGGNRMIGGSGRATMIGGGAGDVLIAGSGPGDVMQAGAGAETLTGATARANTKFYAGAGSDLLIAGRGGSQMLDGIGAATMVGGAGADLFAFASGNAGRVAVQNFVAGQDFVSFLGFASGEAAQALSGAVVAAGSEQLTLSDGTRILFQNVTGLTSSNFL